MSEAGRQDIAAPEVTPSRPRPFSAPDSGADYFATDAHYRSLAARVADAVRRGGRLVLVVGDPPPDAVMILSALASAAAGQFAVLRIACGCESDPEDLLRAVPFGSSGPTPVPPTPPLFVFDAADRLSEKQFEAAFELVMPRGRPPLAGVMLGTCGFPTRLERLRPGIFDNGLAARFSLRDLGREEIEPFIRRQLLNEDEARAFNVAMIGAIADFSGGDPMLVNRLARIMLDNPDWAGGEQEKRSESVVDQPWTAPPRRQLPWALSIALLLCVIAGLLLTREFGEILGPKTAHETSAPAGSITEMPPIALAQEPTLEPLAKPSEAGLEASETVISQQPLQAAEGAVARGNTPALPPDELASLVARGEAFLEARDLTSARLYFERAAEAGDGLAALRMGQTFDPAFLARAGIRAMQGDRQHAFFWYRRASDLGDADANDLLKKLDAR